MTVSASYYKNETESWLPGLPDFQWKFAESAKQLSFFHRSYRTMGYIF